MPTHPDRKQQESRNCCEWQVGGFGVGEGAGGVVAAAAQDQAEQRELLVEQVVTRC